MQRKKPTSAVHLIDWPSVNNLTQVFAHGAKLKREIVSYKPTIKGGQLPLMSPTSSFFYAHVCLNMYLFAILHDNLSVLDWVHSQQAYFQTNRINKSIS